jgi:gas vesicle protein
MAKDSEKKQNTGAGFALGVAIGAAAATLLAPDSGKSTRDKAKAKLDELTGGKTPEELLTAVKQVAGTVIEEIKFGVEEGKKESKREEKRFMDDNVVDQPPKKKKK